MTTTGTQPSGGTPTDTTTLTPADHAAIAALTQRVIAAWAYHDATAFAAVFTDDATMILPGIYLKGRDTIHTYLTTAFQTTYKNTQVTGRPLDIRPLGPAAALLITQGGVLAHGETEVNDDQAIRASWTVTKHNGTWHLAAYQNTPAKKQLPPPTTTNN
jgi:uncharacterized protein (TIGR02246 family)